MSSRSKPQYLSSSSSSSYSSSDSDLSTSSGSTVQVSVLRCLRCARAEEMTSTDDPSSTGMVQIGTNIYYCKRCAKMVGYKEVPWLPASASAMSGHLDPSNMITSAINLQTRDASCTAKSLLHNSAMWDRQLAANTQQLLAGNWCYPLGGLDAGMKPRARTGFPYFVFLLY
ncbi:hypothetical protein B0T19DRAFT_475248 [Cercophora scortea]|uniref:Uncharacterized protein n=1 Tax=Cercophora scortea TaxID=314031 RepID=A0AAE0MD87_9PEZI|nr:hypothetical protein B0T19DRAFT_475248 [Cercophora scortea]